MIASATWRGGYETELSDGRGHRVLIDLPVDEHGADHGTSALELAVLSLAGCITTIFALVARKRRVAFEAMRVELRAERPVGSPTIASVDGTFHIVTSARPEDVETTLEITLRTCPVGVLFDRAGIPVNVRAVIAPPAPTRAALSETAAAAP
jgi:putative redox protein